MESGSRNDARIRGNAQQLLEKYKSLARDATSAGDRILAEYYMQHADHYHRVLSEFRSRYEDNRPRERDDRDERDHDDMNYEDEGAEVTVQQSYGGRNAQHGAQHSLGLEPAAETSAGAQAPAAEPAREAPAAEAAEAPAEEEKPRRRRGRPRKVKPEAEGEAAAENAA